nr:hypothetical protein [Deltaproteobacteria bacterium]
MKRLLVNQRGIILVTTLMVLSLLMGAGTGAIVSTQTDLKISSNLKKNGKAFYIAQAGLHRGWHELVDGDGINDFANVFAAGGPVTLFNNTSFSAGSFTVTAQAVAGSSPTRIKITSSGCLPAANPCPPGNSIAVTESQFQQGSLFSNALFAKEEINITGGSITDSFDSRNGPYDPATAGNEGNASSNGNIALSGTSTTINGDATASGTVTPGGGTITGITSSGALTVQVP